MSYQIKSTPYFRRLVATSKQNGELQRLKEEYDRIKEFNERSIEKKMRQVRLKRLFKEIEEIKESSFSGGRRIRRERKKTQEDLRAEMIRRANELGKEYSKFNGLLQSGSSARQTQSIGTVPLEKILAEKRINYGNSISRLNMQKMSVPKKVPRPFNDSPKKVQSSILYKKRIQYGNGCMKKFMSNGSRIVNSAKIEFQHLPESKPADNVFGRENFILQKKGVLKPLSASRAERARSNWNVAITSIFKAIDYLDGESYVQAPTTVEPIDSCYDVKSAHSKMSISDEEDVDAETSDTSISSYHDSSSELIAVDRYDSISHPVSSVGTLDFQILHEEIAKLDPIPTIIKPSAIQTKFLEKMPNGKDSFEYGVKELRHIFENQN
ncbi:uncharacterized protein LOC119671752 [Teleopsis dalmanni]|uniref:uncharacterized protein LOC119671752 n=1 Tax=Teleopsis dalmanni TaxID=139649 RepID=UPI0018CF5B97|nr:uncharacterized protein LOC119671752 [Teleopsis dalmanni]